MRIRQSLGASVIMAAILLGGAPGAEAANLTGVWAGEQICDRFDGQKFHTKFPDDIMLITQIGDQINVLALLSDGDFNLAYQGTVINDAKKPEREAQAGFTECQTAPGSPYQETVRATKIELKTTGQDQFQATSVFLQLAGDDFPTDTGTCSWRYKRIDEADPGVPDCATLLPPAASSLSTGPATTINTQRRRR